MLGDSVLEEQLCGLEFIRYIVLDIFGGFRSTFPRLTTPLNLGEFHLLAMKSRSHLIEDEIKEAEDEGDVRRLCSMALAVFYSQTFCSWNDEHESNPPPPTRTTFAIHLRSNRESI